MVRRLARGAVVFLDWLAAHDLTLGTCQQADLDRWLTDKSATYREEAGRLTRWASANKLTTAHVASSSWNGAAQLLDHQHRSDVARRLLHDDTLNRKTASDNSDQPDDRRANPGRRRRNPPLPGMRSHPPARTLGIHTDVAVTWQRHSAGDWATYAADVSRRNSTERTGDDRTRR
jgi:hypothetical protein